MPATVDVVIPAYNAETYIVDAVTSVLQQTYTQGSVTVIVVDDGSTDRTLELVRELAEEYANVLLLSAGRTGSPATPRNMGIEHGSGDYLFFLDADDLLDVRALEGLVGAAEESTADVVLGLIEGLNDRSVPRSMFGETTMDADLVEHRLFFSLGPTKLFRRSFVEQHELRFPTDIRVGQDQPFVAEALLLAGRICVLADRTYYYARLADDPTQHLSRSPQTANQIIHRTRRVADIIARYLEPGERRAQLLRRPFGLDLVNAFGTPLTTLPAEEQEQAIRSASDLLTEFPDYLDLAPIEVRKRVLLTLVQRGETQALLDLLAFRAQPTQRDLVVDGSTWAVAVPPSVAQALEPEIRRVDDPGTVCAVTEVALTGELARITGWAGAAKALDPPDAVTIRLSQDHAESVDIAAAISRTVEKIRTHAARFTAEIPLDTLTSGVWELEISTSTHGARSRPAALGEERERRVAPVEHEGASALVIVGPEGQIRIDAGYSQSPLPVRHDAVGLVHDIDGLAELIVDTDAEPDDLEVFASISPAGSRDARLLLPSRKLGPSLLAARLPEASKTVSRARVTVAQGSRERVLVPPRSLALDGDRDAVGVDVDGADLVIAARHRPASAAGRAIALVRRPLAGARRRVAALVRHAGDGRGSV